MASLVDVFLDVKVFPPILFFSLLKLPNASSKIGKSSPSSGENVQTLASLKENSTTFC